MRHTRNQVTAKAGVLHVAEIVNAHGSIFHPVHQENDLGIDGLIEFVDSEESNGCLVAVQIKSGESFVDDSRKCFRVPADRRHIEYWQRVGLPVILIAYSPGKAKAAWISTRDYLDLEKYHGRDTVSVFEIPFSSEFSLAAMSGQLHSLAQMRADERMLLRNADLCLSRDPDVRRNSYFVLTHHPDARRLRIVCLLSRAFLVDEEIETAKDAVFTLGYGVGRNRWSFNPHNTDEREVIEYTTELCSTLTPLEIRRLVELIDDEEFAGPQALGERCLDIIDCCRDTADKVLQEVVADATLPLVRRCHALYLLYECDDESFEEAMKDMKVKGENLELLDWIRGQVDL